MGYLLVAKGVTMPMKDARLAGRFTEVAERRGGRWVYIVDHASADPVPTQ